MLCVVGTVPAEDFPLVEGPVVLKEGQLLIGETAFSIHRGTPALLAAAVQAAAFLGRPAPCACLVGDTGTGKGSRHLYHYLTESLADNLYETITFHYLQPIVHWHRRLQAVLGGLAPRPCLIADAGFMYAAKMSGEASLYDLFTPDVGELAFLADEEAPHPFYTRGFILHEENRVPDLIALAYRHRNAARYLLVKGQRDYLASEQGILATVDSPVIEALEAMGGTGDTLTGLVSVLLDAGMEMEEAGVAALRANRLAGKFACPTPASQIGEVIGHLQAALQEVLGSKRR